MEVIIVCITLGYAFGCIVGFIGGRFVQKKDVKKLKSDYHNGYVTLQKELVEKAEIFGGSMTLKEMFNQHNISTGDKVYVAVEEVCKQYIEQETKLLSQHILELQADKGELTDEVNEAKEIIRRFYRFIFLREDFMELNDFNIWKNKAEDFLKEIIK